MPYELLGKVGLSSAILIVMAVLIYEWIKNTKSLNEDHKEFVKDVMNKCDEREKTLMEHIKRQDEHIEKQDDNLNKIANSLDKLDVRMCNIERNMEK